MLSWHRLGLQALVSQALHSPRAGVADPWGPISLGLGWSPGPHLGRAQRHQVACQSSTVDLLSPGLFTVPCARTWGMGGGSAAATGDPYVPSPELP